MNPPSPAIVGAVRVDEDWLRAVAAATSLVPMRILPGRLQRAPDGAQDLFFASDTGRIVSYLFRPPDGAVLEDGRPLTRAFHIDEVHAGCYMVCRDQVRFRPSDDSDPRDSGREYVVLVPPCVRDAEAHSIADIRRIQL